MRRARSLIHHARPAPVPVHRRVHGWFLFQVRALENHPSRSGASATPSDSKPISRSSWARVWSPLPPSPDSASPGPPPAAPAPGGGPDIVDDTLIRWLQTAAAASAAAARDRALGETRLFFFLATDEPPTGPWDAPGANAAAELRISPGRILRGHEDPFADRLRLERLRSPVVVVVKAPCSGRRPRNRGCLENVQPDAVLVVFEAPPEVVVLGVA
mmetsp:Transcript_11443/g.27916  ORF Transcript_11443/g.27916 Transcript_11443/m.27916 type:complete len:215 (-) Transcript_11443:242-886(-)